MKLNKSCTNPEVAKFVMFYQNKKETSKPSNKNISKIPEFVTEITEFCCWDFIEKIRNTIIKKPKKNDLDEQADILNKKEEEEKTLKPPTKKTFESIYPDLTQDHEKIDRIHNILITKFNYDEENIPLNFMRMILKAVYLISIEKNLIDLNYWDPKDYYLTVSKCLDGDTNSINKIVEKIKSFVIEASYEEIIKYLDDINKFMEFETYLVQTKHKELHIEQFEKITKEILSDKGENSNSFDKKSQMNISLLVDEFLNWEYKQKILDKVIVNTPKHSKIRLFLTQTVEIYNEESIGKNDADNVRLLKEFYLKLLETISNVKGEKLNLQNKEELIDFFNQDCEDDPIMYEWNNHFYSSNY
ncbi:hypothetical protein MHBO_000560 [Bonamia ostreae]|uniref:Uncharacterized protein n=1 Tax=Bonamia ostreae TaxID=126728 RepID=A0ABV2AG29_9EUKA